MPQSCVENYIHIIFSTKDREPLIHSDIEKRLFSYIVGIARKNKTPILKINGTEDHVHILVNLHPSVALSNLIRDFKAYSCAWMKKNGYLQFAWQGGYGGFSYSKSMIDPVIKYIEKQKEHHLKVSFKEEIERLKKQWNINWDL